MILKSVRGGLAGSGWTEEKAVNRRWVAVCCEVCSRVKVVPELRSFFALLKPARNNNNNKTGFVCE